MIKQLVVSQQGRRQHYPGLSAFISYCANFKRQFWLVAAVFALSIIVLTIVPWLIGRLTASATANDNHILLWTALVIGASASHDLLWRSGELLYRHLLLAPSYRVDDVIFSRVVNHEYQFFVDKFTGKVSSYASRLGSDFRELLTNFHYDYVNFIISMPIIVITMFTVNTYTGYIFTFSLVLMVLIGRRLARLDAAAERVTADKRSTMDGYVVDAIANFVSIKAFRSERREAQQLYRKRDSLVQAARYSYKRSIMFWAAMSLFVRWIIWGSTFVLNIYLYRHGIIDLAALSTFLTVIVLFSSFVWDAIWNISQFNIKVAGVEEAYKYLFGSENIFRGQPDADTLPELAAGLTDRLELRNVSFAYPDKPEQNVLDNVTLTIQKGQKVGIVGPSGGGKSTLMKLLLGYYPVGDGQLLLDGQPVATSQLTSLIAYVPQDTAIFHRSIRDNIAYGRDDASQADIVAAAKHAQAHSFICQLADGYDTLVGERGVKLSGGQRQRVAIARAILKDAPILMLDEATSALDSESEKLIQKALADLLEQRTAIVIAHRLSTIQHMDTIVVIDQGKIVEQGSHQELLGRGGMYAELWKHQSGGFIDD